MSYDDDYYEDGWDGDFLTTREKYISILPDTECDYCSRGIIVGERRYKTIYGSVCVDCRDIIREEGEVIE